MLSIGAPPQTVAHTGVHATPPGGNSTVRCVPLAPRCRWPVHCQNIGVDRIARAFVRRLMPRADFFQSRGTPHDFLRDSTSPPTPPPPASFTAVRVRAHTPRDFRSPAGICYRTTRVSRGPLSPKRSTRSARGSSGIPLVFPTFQPRICDPWGTPLSWLLAWIVRKR